MSLSTDHIRLFVQEVLGVELRDDDHEDIPQDSNQYIFTTYGILLRDQPQDVFRPHFAPTGQRYDGRQSQFLQQIQISQVDLPNLLISQVEAHQIVTSLSTRNRQYFARSILNLDAYDGNYHQEERTSQNVVPVQESSNPTSENSQSRNELVNGSLQSTNVAHLRTPRNWTSHRSTNPLTGAVVPSTSVRSNQVAMRGLGLGQSIQFTSDGVNASGEAAATVSIEVHEETKN